MVEETGSEITRKREKPAAPKKTSLLRNIIGFILAIVIIPGLLFAGTCFPIMSSLNFNGRSSSPLEDLGTLGTIILCDGAILGVATLFMLKTRNSGILWALIVMPIALYAYFLTGDMVGIWTFALIAVYMLGCVFWRKNW